MESKGTRQVGLRLEREVLQRLDRMAALARVSRTEFIRRMVQSVPEPKGPWMPWDDGAVEKSNGRE